MRVKSHQVRKAISRSFNVEELQPIGSANFMRPKFLPHAAIFGPHFKPNLDNHHSLLHIKNIKSVVELFLCKFQADLRWKFVEKTSVLSEFLNI